MPPKAKKPAKVGLADLTIGKAVACGACSPSKMKTVVQEGKEKKSKKDAPPAAAMDVVSVDELNQKIATLEKEKNKEEEYRNYMQLERVSCICKYAFTPLRCLFKCYVQPLLECLLTSRSGTIKAGAKLQSYITLNAVTAKRCCAGVNQVTADLFALSSARLGCRIPVLLASTAMLTCEITEMHTYMLVSRHAQHQKVLNAVPDSDSQPVFQLTAVLHPALPFCCTNCMPSEVNLKRWRPSLHASAAGLPGKHCRVLMLSLQPHSVPFTTASQAATPYSKHDSQGS